MPDEPAPSAEEEAELLEHASAALEVALGPERRRRPLRRAAPAAGRRRGRATADLSRRHAVVEDPATGALTVVGGKLTTYRAMAQDAVDRVTRPPVPHRIACRWSARARAAPAAPRRGSRAASAPRRAAVAWPTRLAAEPLAPGVPVCEAELRWAVEHELALTPEDLADRRTRAGLVPEWREAVLAAARCHDPGSSSDPSPPHDVGDVDELISDPETLRFTRVPEPPPDGLRARLVRALRARPRGRRRRGVRDRRRRRRVPRPGARAGDRRRGRRGRARLHRRRARPRPRGRLRGAAAADALGVRGARRPARVPDHRRRQPGLQAGRGARPATGSRASCAAPTSSRAAASTPSCGRGCRAIRGTPALRAGFPFGCSPWGRNPSPQLDSRQPGGAGEALPQEDRRAEVAGPERVPAAPVAAPVRLDLAPPRASRSAGRAPARPRRRCE